MKKWISIILCCVLFFTGCSFHSSSLKEPVSFYYPRNSYVYQTENAVMAPEAREALGHTQDLSYLINLYLAGPLSENLHSPFPADTKLIAITRHNKTLSIELTDSSRSLSDAQFSLACACFARTCIELSESHTVVITSGSRTLSTSMEELLLVDSSTMGLTDSDGGTEP